MTHDFNERLAMSESYKDEPFWDAVYRKAFPNLVSHMPTPGDVASQRMGIDRSILLGSGKTIYTDEKKRGKEYGDILLEYVSVDTTGAPGWIEKDLHIDFLAYAFVTTGRCYLYSWPLLRLAWMENKDKWKREYRLVAAQNKGYKTLSVPVPISVLCRAVNRSSVIDVEVPEIHSAQERLTNEENEHVDRAFSGTFSDGFLFDPDTGREGWAGK